MSDNQWFNQVDWENLREINNIQNYKEELYSTKMWLD